MWTSERSPGILLSVFQIHSFLVSEVIWLKRLVGHQIFSLLSCLMSVLLSLKQTCYNLLMMATEKDTFELLLEFPY